MVVTGPCSVVLHHSFLAFHVSYILIQCYPCVYFLVKCFEDLLQWYARTLRTVITIYVSNSKQSVFSRPITMACSYRTVSNVFTFKLSLFDRPTTVICS